ncbi:hypothetical protein LSH36_40g09000 [Paralvinella palmiformis]|uniref:Uncharacterized protein n=1 Tax=Paralvinella palmiformis TaxID=53620 RepID=A0AAD9NFE2_9ANNE|nr:hypothetical protein LSH36_40g09000 [Paralvinella palmiformis]
MKIVSIKNSFERTSSLIIYPTYASPDVTQKSSLPNASVFSTSDHILNDFGFHYKPPPPYPRPTSSTPDLASQTMRAKKTNSPDLISRRSIHSTGLMIESFLDQSVENLAIDAQKITLNQQMAAQSKQNLDDSSNNIPPKPIQEETFTKSDSRPSAIEKEGGLHPFNFSGDVASHIKTSKSEKEQEDHYLFDLFGGSVQNTRGSSTD